MKSLCVAAITCLALLGVPPAVAGEQTVKLSVSGMWCVGCAYMVKQTLSDVEGVQTVEMSARKKVAVVTFEDTKTDVATLMTATAGAGFPSKVTE